MSGRNTRWVQNYIRGQRWTHTGLGRFLNLLNCDLAFGLQSLRPRLLTACQKPLGLGVQIVISRLIIAGQPPRIALLPPDQSVLGSFGIIVVTGGSTRD